MSNNEQNYWLGAYIEHMYIYLQKHKTFYEVILI